MAWGARGWHPPEHEVVTVYLRPVPGLSQVARVTHDGTAPAAHQTLLQQGVHVPGHHLEQLLDGVVQVTGLFLPLEPLWAEDAGHSQSGCVTSGPRCQAPSPLWLVTQPLPSTLLSAGHLEMQVAQTATSPARSPRATQGDGKARDHSLILQRFIEHLLCARYSSGLDAMRLAGMSKAHGRRVG